MMDAASKCQNQLVVFTFNKKVGIAHGDKWSEGADYVVKTSKGTNTPVPQLVPEDSKLFRLYMEYHDLSLMKMVNQAGGAYESKGDASVADYDLSEDDK
jgi:hypothetical protein